MRRRAEDSGKGPVRAWREEGKGQETSRCLEPEGGAGDGRAASVGPRLREHRPPGPGHRPDVPRQQHGPWAPRQPAPALASLHPSEGGKPASKPRLGQVCPGEAVAPAAALES